MRHELDWWTTKCSCKGWGCKVCGASNKQISLHNDLLKFGLPKEKLKENLNEVNKYLGKIDAYTLYEYIAGEIDEEKFNTAVENFKPWIKSYTPKKPSVKEFKPTPNPERQCVFDWRSPWDRCKRCNSIRKYMQWKECPMYVENLGDTVTENE